MTMLLVIVWFSVCIMLLLHFSVRLRRTTHSHFELKRRGNEEALRYERLFDALTSFRRFAGLIVVIIATSLAIVIWQGWGVVYMTVAIIVVLTLSRSSIARRLGRRMYEPFEPRILQLLEDFPLIATMTGAVKATFNDQKIESVEHLRHLIETSGNVLSGEQQTIIRHGLDWHTTPVDTIMTPVKDVFSIKHAELLGPLVLDDLHRSGHTRFPVTHGDIDTVVGVLDISQELDVSSGKRSETAEKVMSSQVLRIEADEPLPAAFDMLQKSHLHMLIVVDAEGKTMGVVTLADIAASLLGKNRGGVV